MAILVFCLCVFEFCGVIIKLGPDHAAYFCKPCLRVEFCGFVPNLEYLTLDQSGRCRRTALLAGRGGRTSSTSACSSPGVPP